ncbi:cadherin EGF LAG seven-pass G-type receptor 2-like protein [Lates japonicus]|uniref:Cadherin EGF LAG seven-pass G-type receptor 2-like protein n=1 Tax=Lates japonicus TaxID=270547 RepID=A0AAD3NLC8_LATJO|nr:cadherin EGF LAG seven-pass G-type receptor 2-like protein [Lates japonicus]
MAPNTEILQVTATDQDRGATLSFTSGIMSGNTGGQFYIDAQTADLVAVQVLGVNDNAPIAVSTPFQATVLENMPLGYSIIHIGQWMQTLGTTPGWVDSVVTVSAVDQDIVVVTYQISSGNTATDSPSRVRWRAYRWRCATDYKLERRYILTVTAVMGHGSTAKVFDGVTDANTHRPVFPELTLHPSPVDIGPDTGAVTTQAGWTTRTRSPTLAITPGTTASQKSDTTYWRYWLMTSRQLPAFSETTMWVHSDGDVPVFTSVVQVSAIVRDSGLNGESSTHPSRVGRGQ